MIDAIFDWGLTLFLVGLTIYAIFWLIPWLWTLIQFLRDEWALAHLTDTKDLEARLNRLAAEYVASRPQAKLTIGIVQKGNRFVKGYNGQKADGPPPDENSLYEIGSITKVFTALMLAKLDQEGVVSISQSLADLLPEDHNYPEEIRRIRLGQLATHTAGLPRLPSNLDEFVKDEADPYVWYARAQLFAGLANTTLEQAPGTKSSYSNYGMGLLGQLLAMKTGENYEGLCKRLIAEPLRLTATCCSPDEATGSRLVVGRTPKGDPAPNWHFDALAGAGALRSSARDLLTFLEANRNPSEDALGQAMEKTQEIHFRTWLGPHQGLAWVIEQDDPKNPAWFWHNGATGGYCSFAAFDPAKQLSLVLLSNYGDASIGDGSLDHMGMKILRIAAKVSLEESAADKQAAASN